MKYSVEISERRGDRCIIQKKKNTILRNKYESWIYFNVKWWHGTFLRSQPSVRLFCPIHFISFLSFTLSSFSLFFSLFLSCQLFLSWPCPPHIMTWANTTLLYFTTFTVALSVSVFLLFYCDMRHTWRRCGCCYSNTWGHVVLIESHRLN